MREHTVVQGEHLSRIATHHGFALATLWDHPENAKLRRLRGNPDVLLPGDVVVIPDRELKAVASSSGAHLRFVLKRAPLTLKLAFVDLQGKPIAAAHVQLRLGDAVDLVTDGDGRIERAIEGSDERGEVALAQGVAELRVGHLDPIEEDTGVRARLSNLGYLIGAVEDADDGEELRLALQEFQADHELPFTGELDDATRAKLADVHGC
jgi:hypothetical protein